MKLTPEQTAAARRVGAALARDAKADAEIAAGGWSDDALSGDDGAILTAAGIEPDTDAWTTALAEAATEYARMAK